MNKLLTLFLVLNLSLISNSGCTPKDKGNEIQKEEAIDPDDFREKDSFHKNVPLENEEELPE